MGEFNGIRLREIREEKKLSFGDIEQAIKIREKYLRALEEENYEIFPAEIYVTGFLSSYSKYLGLDEDDVVKNYWRTHQEKDHLNKPREDLVKVTKTNNSSLFVKKTGIIIGVALGSALLLFSFFWSKSESNKKDAVGESIYREVPVVLPPEIKIPEEVYLEIKGEKSTWLRVTADGELAYEGLIKKDEVMFLEAKRDFRLRIGNIFGIKVKFNGDLVDLGSGQRGDVNEIFLEKEPE
ncbi:helix-turn-helix domain-containing protein [bacterium]|nr:helix-turn-helix domain-containing protein [bacterium]